MTKIKLSRIEKRRHNPNYPDFVELRKSERDALCKAVIAAKEMAQGYNDDCGDVAIIGLEEALSVFSFGDEDEQ